MYEPNGAIYSGRGIRRGLVARRGQWTLIDPTSAGASASRASDTVAIQEAPLSGMADCYGTPRSILSPIDFSEQSRHALRWAGEFAARIQAHLTVAGCRRFVAQHLVGPV
jgi:hypothetical protein